MYFYRILFVACLAFLLVESYYVAPTTCGGDPNALPSNCSNQCVNNCENQVCTMACEKGCSCKTNYVYDNAVKRCVLPKACTPTTCGGDPNALPSNCSNQCVNNCEKRMCTLACQKGCSCKPNYVYDNKVQRCVLPKACTPTTCGGDPNALPSNCSNQCINNCEKRMCTLACQKGCSCKPNYVYDNKVQRCVLPKACTPTTCGGDPNALPSNCSNQCVNNCENQVCTMACEKGCSCKTNYVYDNAAKRCVLPKVCTPTTCGGDPNALPSNCSNQCVNNCEKRMCTLACQKGCSCKPNYVYDNKVQRCVLPKACTPSTCGGDPNALPSNCSNQCVNNCVKGICTLACQKGCSCKKNYVYDSIVQRCVLPKACTPCGGDSNALPSNCSNQCVNNCEYQICTMACEKGCSCKTNYVYDNAVRRCVLPKACTSCGGDPNAYPDDCSNQCVNNCDKKRMCILACQKGCSCKDNYVYDDKVQRCVLPNTCSNRRGYY